MGGPVSRESLDPRRLLLPPDRSRSLDVPTPPHPAQIGSSSDGGLPRLDEKPWLIEPRAGASFEPAGHPTWTMAEPRAPMKRTSNGSIRSSAVPCGVTPGESATPAAQFDAARRRCVGRQDIDAESTFALLAELSLGLAGFGGVAAAFGGSSRQYTRAELTRLRALFFHASLSLALSLLGTSLLWFELPIASVAFWACCLGALVHLPVSVYLTVRAHRFAKDQQTTTTWLVFWAVTVPTWLAGGFYAAGAAAGGSIALLVSGLSLQLLLGLWMFVRVLTLRD